MVVTVFVKVLAKVDFLGLGDGVRLGGLEGGLVVLVDWESESESWEVLSGRDSVDVDRTSEPAVGRSIGRFSCAGFPDFPRPAMPLVTTWVWTPRNGTSRPSMPIML